MATLTTSQELYCVIPKHLADTLLEPLREHLASYGIATIVEQRDTTRPAPYDVARQRAMHLPRALPELPAHLAAHTDEIQFVQRMAPAGLTLADHELLEVVRAAGEGDGFAASELVFRMSARVFSRLECRHSAGTKTEIERALGRMIDRVDEFHGYETADFYRWLDTVVDDR